MVSDLAKQTHTNIVDAPDSELLRRYLAGRELPALELLVQRHGNMVWGVCRRMLSDPHEAEDAFQATFLVFVRRASAIRPGVRIASWLHSIATRTALKARALSARRRAREKQVESLPHVVAPPSETIPDWAPLLDHEIAKLPARYRKTVLLCELNGMSRTEAAQALGIPEGTLSSRLARARAMLRRRLSKRGIGAAALAGLFLIPLSTATAAPKELIQTTVQAIPAFAAGARTTAALLAIAVLRSWRRGRIVLLSSLVVSIALLGGLAAIMWRDIAMAAVVDSRTDREKLQGEWAVTALTVDGMNARPEDLPKEVLVFNGDRVNMPIDSDYILDTKSNPKRINMTCRIIGPPNNCMLGIYEVKGDELKLCLSPPGHDRPTGFENPRGSLWTSISLKRQPPTL